MFFDGLDLAPLKKNNKLEGGAYSNVYVAPPERAVEYFTYDELVAARGSVLIFDVEVYSNYWLVAFKQPQTNKVIYFEFGEGENIANNETLIWVLQSFVLVGFNSNKYDMLMIMLALRGLPCGQIKAASDQIILYDVTAHQIIKDYDLNMPFLNHVDLIEVAPIQASLKTYAARLHCERMQDLPFDPNKPLTDEQAHVTKLYCINDLDNTALLLKELEPQLDLRHQLSVEYGTDLRSMSDAQLAEAVILKELRKLSPKGLKKPDIDSEYTCQYKAPEWLSYRVPALQAMLETVKGAVFHMDKAGSPKMPDALKSLSIRLGGCVYRLGMGGLHSSEKSISHVADTETLLIDRDVASYYPAIILNQGLFPKHLGGNFLLVYRTIVERRLAAKKAKRKLEADSLKITINGSFGKLGSPYSMLYSPDLMLQVTITGQLCLLMLIEMIEDVGIPVVSANTDGIVIKCPQGRYSDLENTVKSWETITRFETEETRYRSIWSRDVNNYIAIKEDGECKAKGVYSEKGSALNSRLSKNPEHLICSDAVMAFLSKQIPIEDTINASNDFTRFLSVKKVAGGGHKEGVYLGKVVRWYYAKGATGAINSAKSGNKVGKSDFGKPIMDLPSVIPTDLDREWYIATAWEMLADLGYYNQNGKGQLI